MSSGRIPSVEGGIQPTIVDAKGDLIVATAADTVSRLAVGTNNYVLTADSAEATGLKWAAAAGGGKVLQVVSSVSTTATTITSTSYTDTNLSVSITPSSTSSKVLVLVSQSLIMDRSSTAMNTYTSLVRGSTLIFQPYVFGIYVAGVTAVQLNVVVPLAYLDSPSTTSSTTYKTQGKVDGAGTSRYQYASTESSIIAMEIGA